MSALSWLRVQLQAGVSTAEGFGETYDGWCERRGLLSDWTKMGPLFGRQAKENWRAFHEREEPQDMSQAGPSRIELLHERLGGPAVSTVERTVRRK